MIGEHERPAGARAPIFSIKPSGKPTMGRSLHKFLKLSIIVDANIENIFF